MDKTAELNQLLGFQPSIPPKLIRAFVPALQVALADGKHLDMDKRLLVNADWYRQSVEADSWEVRQCTMLLEGMLKILGKSAAGIAVIKDIVRVGGVDTTV